MGLAKFAVQTSAETEIVHELTFEPAHSKVGVGRTIPFDQMIVGAYTTAQLHDHEGHVGGRQSSPSSTPKSLRKTVNSTQLIQELKDQKVGANQLPLRFRTIPADEAPTLMRVMEEFAHHHLAAVEAKELPGCLGRAGDHG